MGSFHKKKGFWFIGRNSPKSYGMSIASQHSRGGGFKPGYFFVNSVTVGVSKVFKNKSSLLVVIYFVEVCTESWMHAAAFNGYFQGKHQIRVPFGGGDSHLLLHSLDHRGIYPPHSTLTSKRVKKKYGNCVHIVCSWHILDCGFKDNWNLCCKFTYLTHSALLDCC